MKTFEERLQRLDAASSRRAEQRQSAAGVTQGSAQSGMFRQIIMFPITLALGAAAVLAGGIVQVVVIDGGMSPSTSIPPDLGIASFVIAFAVSLICNKLVGRGFFGSIGVTIGFVAMIRGEWRLAEEFPALWATLYKGTYLQPAIQLAGL